MTVIVESAPAKVNLSLEILGRRGDGYHELVSLVAFAIDVCDAVRLEPDAELSVEVAGRFAEQIAGPNLVTKAAELARAVSPGSQLGRFAIDKRIPVAAGVGGGSADAAAALRAIARASGMVDPVQAFGAVAPRIGADVMVCLGGGGQQAAVISGVGERVWRPDDGALLAGAEVYGVLVNPGVQVATAEVFKALVAPAYSGGAPSPTPVMFANFDALMGYLGTTSNDLQPPAIAIAPVISEVVAALSVQPDCRLARMSGSGATCFGLFATRAQAERAAAAISALQPRWWVTHSRLA